jgi:hypothetical protein
MSDLDSLQKDVLIGIGRNVLNLQKMEGMLKYLVLSVQSTVPVENAEKVIENIEKRKKTISNRSLGLLAGDFVRSLRSGHSGTEEQPAQIEVATVSTSITFEDGNFVDELEASLRSIVEERNELIHNKLAAFDPKSPESCRNLAKELEEQRQRIKPKFKELAAICTAVSEQIKELKEYSDSGQFENDWKAAQDSLEKSNH